jgi:hypothetical protein
LTLQGIFKGPKKVLELVKKREQRTDWDQNLNFAVMDATTIYWKVLIINLVDTMNHCFEVLLELIKCEECQDVIGDVGMPVIHVSAITF